MTFIVTSLSLSLSLSLCVCKCHTSLPLKKKQKRKSSATGKHPTSGRHISDKRYHSSYHDTHPTTQLRPRGRKPGDRGRVGRVGWGWRVGWRGGGSTLNVNYLDQGKGPVDKRKRMHQLSGRQRCGPAQQQQQQQRRRRRRRRRRSGAGFNEASRYRLSLALGDGRPQTCHSLGYTSPPPPPPPHHTPFPSSLGLSDRPSLP